MIVWFIWFGLCIWVRQKVCISVTFGHAFYSMVYSCELLVYRVTFSWHVPVGIRQTSYQGTADHIKNIRWGLLFNTYYCSSALSLLLRAHDDDIRDILFGNLTFFTLNILDGCFCYYLFTLVFVLDFWCVDFCESMKEWQMVSCRYVVRLTLAVIAPGWWLDQIKYYRVILIGIGWLLCCVASA